MIIIPSPSPSTVEKPEVSISTYNTSGSGTYLVVGTELKLTCTAVIKELSQDIAIDILMTWAIPGRIIDEYRPVISQENDCRVSFEHHIPSLSFNHSNNYTCIVTLNSPYSDVKASSKSILVTVRGKMTLSPPPSPSPSPFPSIYSSKRMQYKIYK